MVTFLEDTIKSVEICDEIKVAVLFGSYARLLKGGTDVPDQYSDIDLQLLVRNVDYFKDTRWLSHLFSTQVVSASYRSVFGGARKAVIMFENGSIDAVVLSHKLLTIARLLHKCQVHKWNRKFRDRMTNFSDLMRFDHVVIKGNAAWKKFYQNAGTLGRRLQLTDQEILKITSIVCEEASSILGRIERGELIAAQRILHQEIVEANIKLLHELRERSGMKSYHRGRRAETTLEPEELSLISVNALCTKNDLRKATIQMLNANASLVLRLTGRPPSWENSNFFRSISSEL